MAIPFKGNYQSVSALIGQGRPPETLAYAYTNEPELLWVWSSQSSASADQQQTLSFDANPGRWTQDPSVIAAMMGTIAFSLGSDRTYFVDPQNSSNVASDNNVGTDTNHPYLTLARFFQAIGGRQPDLGVTTTITLNMLSDTNASDPFECTPLTGRIVVVGKLTATALAGNFTSVTARNLATGQRWNVNVAAATWVVGTLIIDATIVNGGFMIVQSDLGGGTALVTQPMASGLSSGATFPVPAQVTPANGDVFTTFTMSKMHVTVAGAPYPPSAIIFQRCHILGVSTAVDPSFPGNVSMQECWVDTYGYYNSILETDPAPGVSAPFGGRLTAINTLYSKGGFFENPEIIGGNVTGTFLVTGFSMNAVLDGGVTFDANAIPANWFGGRIWVGDVGIFGGSFNPGASGQGGRHTTTVITTGTVLAASGYTAKLWGTAALAIHSNVWLCYSVTATAEITTTGAITLAGQTSASSYDPATATWAVVAGPITPTVIDTAPTGVLAPHKNCGIIKEA